MLMPLIDSSNLTGEAREFARMSRVNICRLVVAVPAQSMYVTGFRDADRTDDDPALWGMWQANKLSAQDADFRGTYDKHSNLVTSLENVKDKIGPVYGRVANINKALGGDAKLQEAKTRLTEFVASMRKFYAGAAVTSTELEALGDYVDGKTTEKFENIMAKVNTILDTSKSVYNQTRASVGLPLIDDATINDRSSLYFSKARKAIDTTSTQEKNDPFGIR
jgi:hypothetical protein